MKIFDGVFLLATLGLLGRLSWQRWHGRVQGPNGSATATFLASFAVQSLSHLIGENPLGWMLLGAATVGIVVSCVLSFRATRAFWRAEMERVKRL